MAMMNDDILYIQRCLELAQLGLGHVSPNPMVGAVLVYQNRILAEGFHRCYGEAHAEINCLNAVRAEDRKFIPESTLYVSLEPCCHTGKTPPCTDRIIQEKIPSVVILNIDPNPLVQGRGLDLLQQAGVEVKRLANQDAGWMLNRRFWTQQIHRRPYVILKWAMDSEGMMGKSDERIQISNAMSQQLVHQWRTEEDAIWVGYRTILTDNPELNVRFVPGRSPRPLFYDRDLSLPATLKIFRNSDKLVFHSSEHGDKDLLIDDADNFVPEILNRCLQKNIGSILIEGGPHLLEKIIRCGLYDELRIISSDHRIGGNLPAPEKRKNWHLMDNYSLGSDTISMYLNVTTQTWLS
ncbi:MAG: bifunctional diaminohydroxyphosphoribosylaminopyrimidine deaminase/5-amino-6-(5-phosphoribosylamino)uracil reductase RibD [Chitinophagaceae bacterium]|nr:bifunctional diaminohydroxyphosphoribosylaminopyrimidine deaminase/5-amino-6-(5-phosphoribosylamino)uracil reductase RibD [Chitinophagaceae bacterium]